MRYAEVNILGTYIAPFALMMLAAWLVVLPLQRCFDRSRLGRYVWHPALFNISVYVIVLSSIVLAVGRW